MKKLSVIGLFCENKEVSNGQSIKTRIVTQEIQKALGDKNVGKIDTFGWKQNPLKLFANCIIAVQRSSNVMFLTDEGGIRVFPWLLRWANIRGKCKIHYYVVGGWLGKYLDKFPRAVMSMKKLDAIYVEVPAMFRELAERGFTNGVLVNKFRRMTPASVEELDLKPQPPYKLCYFSRVMKEKGVEECIEAVKMANHRAGYEKYMLDIYGSVNELYREEFEAQEKQFPSYIRYGGVVDFQNSTQTLKNYFVMLFPTYYASEGYPNAVVDAFSAGLPVIATRWNYNAEIIRDREDGVLVDVGSIEQIVDAIEELSKNIPLYEAMRRNCIARCEEYLPENAIATVIGKMRD